MDDLPGATTGTLIGEVLSVQHIYIGFKTVSTELSLPPIPEGIRVMPGNGVYAVRPEKDDYQACITYIVDNPDLPFVLHVERDANVSDIMKSKGGERVRRFMIWRESQDIRDFEALTNLRSLNIGSSQAFDFSRLKLLEKVGRLVEKLARP